MFQLVKVSVDVSSCSWKEFNRRKEGGDREEGSRKGRREGGREKGSPGNPREGNG